VPYYNLLGDREAKAASSEIYKKYIRKYLQAKGYLFKSDSKIEGHLPDLVFIDITNETYREIWVEAKWSDFSFNDDNFLAEFSRYLVSYFRKPIEQRFRFMIFVRKTRNVRFHKNLLIKLNEEEILGIISKTKQHVKLDEDIELFEKLGVDDLKSFFGKIELYQADIDALKIRTEQLINKEFDPSNIFSKYDSLIETSYLIEEKDTVLANLFEIEGLKTIWQAHTNYRSSEEIFSNIGFAPPFVLYGGNIISLYRFNEENELSNLVDINTITEISVSDWIRYKDKKNLLYNLLIKTATKLCRLRGMISDNKSRWFYPLKNSLEVPRIKKWKKGNRTYQRIVAKPMLKDGKLNFCYHMSVIFKTYNEKNKLYFSIIPQKTFTLDGIKPVSSVAYERIERKYRKPMMGYNQNALNDVFFWYYILFEHYDIYSDPLNMTERQREFQYHTRKILRKLNVQPIYRMVINHKPIEDPNNLQLFNKIADYEITDFLGDEK